MPSRAAIVWCAFVRKAAVATDRVVRGAGTTGILLVSFGVVGCGWHPVYAPQTAQALQPVLASIDVALIPERSGQLLREALQARLQGSGIDVPPEYRLVTRYSVSQDGLATTQASAVTRYRLIGTASFVLSTVEGQARTCTSGTIRQVDGFDAVDTQFFALDLAAETVGRRLASAVADEITNRLALALGSARGHESGRACES